MHIFAILFFFLFFTGDPEPLDKSFDPSAMVDALGLKGKAAQTVLEKLEAIQQEALTFHTTRIAKETAFAGRLEENQNIEAFTQELLTLAEKHQKNIDGLAKEIESALDPKTLKRFEKMELPRLAEPGEKVYGMFRRPPSMDDWMKKRMKRRKEREAQAGEKLEFAFDHERHPEIDGGCVNCHTTDKEDAIKEAFADYAGMANMPSMMRRVPEEIPVMDRCMSCHEAVEEGEENTCQLCHPNYKAEQGALNPAYNPFDNLKTGLKAPAFSLPTLDGENFVSVSLLNKEYLVVQFGSST
ncbi:MAG: cytochrome c3 family protein [Planctomycetota bacterium]|jgi:hypothetical protein